MPVVSLHTLKQHRAIDLPTLPNIPISVLLVRVSYSKFGTMPLISTITHRVFQSLTTLPPSARAWGHVVGITTATTAVGGVAAIATGFVDPLHDFNPPTAAAAGVVGAWCKPASALLVPGLVEEVIWRGAMLSPSTSSIWWCSTVIVLHVAAHPVAAATIWPRGGSLFSDKRFLLLALLVSVGATSSYLVSGGSVWAAAITHGVPVALWRDFFGGEAKLLRYLHTKQEQSQDEEEEEQQQHEEQQEPLNRQEHQSTTISGRIDRD